MNNDYEDELEIQKTKTVSKMVFVTTIVFVLTLVLFGLYIKYTISAFLNSIGQIVYYYVDVDDKNKDEIANLIKDEEYYCDSMYKIEFSIYQNSKKISYTVYCKDEEQKSFYADNEELEDYIYINGKVERR